MDVWHSMLEANRQGKLPVGGLDRLRTFLCDGVDVSSAYSGMAGDIMGCQFMSQAIQIFK
jgi:hypothetical protein